MISVIIPVFNEEKNIHAICSDLLNQTLQDFEVVIVDDGSTDQTLPILKTIQQGNPNMTMTILHQNHGGVSRARNAGIDHAKGDYVAFVDGDDRIANNYLEELWKLVIEYNADWVTCGLSSFVNGQFQWSHYSFGQDTVYTNDQVKAEIIPTIFCKREKDLNPLYYSTCSLIRKSIIDQHNVRFNPDVVLGEDVVFNTELAWYVDVFVYTHQSLYEYHLSEQSSTWQYRPNRMEEVRKLCKALAQIDHRIGIAILPEQLRYLLGTLSDVFRTYIAHPKSRLYYQERKQEYRRFDKMLHEDPYVSIVWNALNYKVLKGKGGQARYFLFKHRLYELFRCLLVIYQKGKRIS